MISGFTNGNYVYNENGNLISDGPNGNSISYNYLNLPQQVTGNQNVTYTYDATGNKLKKVSSSPGTTDYIDGIVYNGSGIIDFIQTEEGIARNNSGVYSYEYNQADHLGNVRTSFRKNPVSGILEPLQRDDYSLLFYFSSMVFMNSAKPRLLCIWLKKDCKWWNK